MRGTTLPGALDEAAATGPDVAVSFPSSAERLTLAELAARTTALARALVADGVAPGERIGVFSRNNADFVTAVIAVGRAGAAACPLPLPTSAGDLAGYAARIAAVTSAAGVSRVLVGAGADGLTRRLAPVLGALRFDGIAGLTRSARDGVALPAVSPSDLAIVQFTSGSTAVPKGVVLTHRNVVHGTAAIVDGIGLGDGDHGATWLPLYHDMGLFGALSAILTAVPMTIWSPTTFIKDPASWLRAFAEIGATVAPSPNFGYDALLAALGPDELAGLDLRRWRVALNGAEPVSPVTVARFGAHFAPAGFAPEAMFPVYGMAEATLAVTFPPLGRPPVTTWVDRDRLARDGIAVPVPAGAAAARGLVGVGRPVRGMRLRIVDDERRTVADGTVGEIEIAGDAVTAGYLTAGGTPTAIEADPSGERWLPTGDLGFLLAGELHVSGRRKEMIIVRGVNYYPEDAEALVRDAPGVHRRRCVAVAAADTDESGAGVES
ncbi:AMP-binding protein, partial [Frankia sp. AvcI1]